MISIPYYYKKAQASPQRPLRKRFVGVFGWMLPVAGLTAWDIIRSFDIQIKASWPYSIG
jgi:hypothetical protein